MTDVYEGTLKWLNQQVPQQKARPSLMDIATEDLDSQEEKVEMPGPFATLLSMRRFNTMYWEGGYADQPHILMWELERAAEAEEEFEYIQRRNAELRARNAQQQRQTPSWAQA